MGKILKVQLEKQKQEELMKIILDEVENDIYITTGILEKESFEQIKRARNI